MKAHRDFIHFRLKHDDGLHHFPFVMPILPKQISVTHMDTNNNGDVQNTALAPCKYITQLNSCANCTDINSLQNKCSFTEKSPLIEANEYHHKEHLLLLKTQQVVSNAGPRCPKFFLYTEGLKNVNELSQGSNTTYRTKNTFRKLLGKI